MTSREYRDGFMDGWNAAQGGTRIADVELPRSGSTRKGDFRKTARRAFEKPKRKPSAYNKRYSAEYKRQAKKHPRLKFAALSKRTHKALKRK